MSTSFVTVSEACVLMKHYSFSPPQNLLFHQHLPRGELSTGMLLTCSSSQGRKWGALVFRVRKAFCGPPTKSKGLCNYSDHQNQTENKTKDAFIRQWLLLLPHHAMESNCLDSHPAPLCLGRVASYLTFESSSLSHWWNGNDDSAYVTVLEMSYKMMHARSPSRTKHFINDGYRSRKHNLRETRTCVWRKWCDSNVPPLLRLLLQHWVSSSLLVQASWLKCLKNVGSL